MQQQPQIFPVVPSFPPTSITTEQIQKYLDENKKLIMAILDNQNLGKLAECAQYQALLQRNLMYLAAIADAQPQAPVMPSQMAAHPAMQQGGGYFMQHPQAAAAMMAQQSSGTFPAKIPMQFNTPHQMPEHQMGMRPGAAVNNGLHTMVQSEAMGHGHGHGGGLPQNDVHGSGGDAAPDAAESSYLKGLDEAK